MSLLSSMNLPPLKFHSFKEAGNYRTTCPLCNNPLHINDRDLATDYGHEFRGGKPRISFFVNQREDDTITIDPETDEVELILSNRLPEELLTDLSPAAQKIMAPPVYNGRFMHGLTIDCKSCCQYAFTLQIHFNLTDKSLFGTYLNSESISIEEGEMVHEIKNSYATQITYYSYFDKEGDSKRLSLPLIPLDLSDPKETVARISNLLIFS